MNINRKKYNYGDCQICGAPIEEKIITQDFWIRGNLIVVENIPAGVCSQCGERIVKAEIGHWISKLIEDTEMIKKAPRISVPSIKFNEEEILSQ